MTITLHNGLQDFNTKNLSIILCYRHREEDLTLYDSNGAIDGKTAFVNFSAYDDSEQTPASSGGSFYPY